MKLLRYKIFLLVLIISFPVLSTVDEDIDNNLKKIEKIFNKRDVTIKELMSLEEINQISNSATNEDKEKFLQLSNNFLTILQHEHYLYENSMAKWGLAVSGGFAAGGSYAFSWLKPLKPSCLFPECPENALKFYQYAANMLCVNSEPALLCLQEIKRSGARDITKYAIFSKECFVGLDPALEGAPIDFTIAELVKSPACEAAMGALLSAPAVMSGMLACGLCLGAGYVVYNNYSKKSEIKNIYNCSAQYPELMIERIRKSFPGHEAVINLIGALLVEKDQIINQAWVNADKLHIHYPLKSKSSKSE